MDRLAAIFDELQYFVGVGIFLLGMSGPVLKNYSAEHQMMVGLGLAILAHIRMQRARDRQRIDTDRGEVQTTAVRLE